MQTFKVLLPGSFQGGSLVSAEIERGYLRLKYLKEAVIVSFTATELIEDIMVRDIKEALLTLVNDECIDRIVLNLNGVTCMLSPALSMFVTLEHRVKACNGRLSFYNVHRKIVDVFNITKLRRTFIVTGSEEEALAVVDVA